MVRPLKLRRVESLPDIKEFGPENKKIKEVIIMSVEEYETIRLIDYQNYTQLECSERMHVARTTIQKIYDDARYKIADAIINGKTLKIEGGIYLLNSKSDHNEERRKKEMIITIPVNEKNLETAVSRNLARANYLMFYNTETKTAEFLDNDAKNASGGAGVTAGQFIVDHNANVVITPRCGENAYKVLNGKTDVLKAIDGSVQTNIDACIDGKLEALTEIHKGNHGHA